MLDHLLDFMDKFNSVEHSDPTTHEDNLVGHSLLPEATPQQWDSWVSHHHSDLTSPEDHLVGHSPLLELAPEQLGSWVGHHDPGLSALDDGAHWLHGQPDYYKQFWHHQEGNNSCAVAVQTDVYQSLHELLGLPPVSESQFAQEAMQQGLYDPESGTSPEAMGQLLVRHGIPVTESRNTSLLTIDDALLRHQRVMVFLNGYEIREPLTDVNGEPMKHFKMGGHAVWVTGIERDHSGNISVILNDTGHGNGAESRVPLKHFMNAWDSFNRFAAITNVPYGVEYV